MKKMKTLLLVLPVVTAGIGFAGGVFAAAAKGKEIVVTPAAEVKFEPLDPADKEMKGPSYSVVFGDMKKKGSPESTSGTTRGSSPCAGRRPG